MRLRAALDELHHAHILAFIQCDQFEEPKPIHFMVDSGCSVTTILSDSAKLLGINCEGLNNAYEVTTANGNVTPYILENVMLIFEFQYGILHYKQRFKGKIMKEIHCHSPVNGHDLATLNIENSYSLLGMDFLYQFKKWQFTDSHLFLQK